MASIAGGSSSNGFVHRMMRVRLGLSAIAPAQSVLTSRMVSRALQSQRADSAYQTDGEKGSDGGAERPMLNDLLVVLAQMLDRGEVRAATLLIEYLSSTKLGRAELSCKQLVYNDQMTEFLKRHSEDLSRDSHDFVQNCLNEASRRSSKAATANGRTFSIITPPPEGRPEGGRRARNLSRIASGRPTAASSCSESNKGRETLPGRRGASSHEVRTRAEDHGLFRDQNVDADASGRRWAREQSGSKQSVARSSWECDPRGQPASSVARDSESRMQRTPRAAPERATAGPTRGSHSQAGAGDGVLRNRSFGRHGGARDSFKEREALRRVTSSGSSSGDDSGDQGDDESDAESIAPTRASQHNQGHQSFIQPRAPPGAPGGHRRVGNGRPHRVGTGSTGSARGTSSTGSARGTGTNGSTAESIAHARDLRPHQDAQESYRPAPRSERGQSTATRAVGLPHGVPAPQHDGREDHRRPDA